MRDPTLLGRQGKHVLGGRYELLSLLGQGGMAEVHSALDHLLGRPVAIKLLRDHLASDDRAVARFRREARAVAALCHPNIVSVYDIGFDGDAPFIVMELVQGEALSQLIYREAPLPPEGVAEVGETVAQALAFAHDAGIVHRDVKPSNIMLTRSGHVKVLDFGIARVLSWTPLTDAASVQGTAEYVSPEQAQGRELDGRSDIYSLGSVLYEMLAGRPPFVGETPLAVAYKHLHEDPPPLHSIRADVPAALDGMVAKCLAKDPNDRYQRASRLASGLSRFRSSPTGTTVPMPPLRETDTLDFPQIAGWGQTRGDRSRFVSPSALTVGVLALLFGLLVAVSAIVVPLFLRGGAQVVARPQSLDPPMALQARGACDGFFKAKTTLTWLSTSSSFADGYAVYRSTSRDGPFFRVELLPGRTSASWVDANLDTGTRYYYTIRATAGVRLSDYSTLAETHTPSFCL